MIPHPLQAILRPHRRWLLPLGLLGLFIPGWLVLVGGETDGDWISVHPGDLILAVEVTGTLRAAESSFLGPPQLPQIWQFKIAMMAPEGAAVEAGTPVLAFDTSELARELEAKRAERDTAAKEWEKKGAELATQQADNELKLAEAEARLRRRELAAAQPPELVAGNQLQLARLDYDLAKLEVDYLRRKLDLSARAGQAELAALEETRKRAEERVREIQEAMDRMRVVAPRAGTVIYVTDGRQEKRKVGDSVWRGTKVLEIPDLRRMVAEGEIDEADAGQVAPGQRVRLRLDAHPDMEYGGRVASIARTVQQRSWRNPAKIVRLTIELDQTDTQRMRPGMRFRGELEVERLEGVLVLPLEAVDVTPQGPVAYRKGLLGTEGVPLRLGRRNDKLVEVLDGLAPGDRVLRRPPQARGETQ